MRLPPAPSNDLSADVADQLFPVLLAPQCVVVSIRARAVLQATVRFPDEAKLFPPEVDAGNGRVLIAEPALELRTREIELDTAAAYVGLKRRLAQGVGLADDLHRVANSRPRPLCTQHLLHLLARSAAS